MTARKDSRSMKSKLIRILHQSFQKMH
ncbi:Arc family DNA-binding protein [Rhodophyticola porphyridii]|uniref:Arc family DNA-binding protein n=1 Tax=Rhodophyticola porphyridii TaxID=1852017 RepID=A0A3L9Y0E3_9RHOB|nr:Arc family DNA-binding protein [Rhodophyticola porphyridii]